MIQEKHKVRVLRLLESVDKSLDVLDDWARVFRSQIDRRDWADIETLSYVERNLGNAVRRLPAEKG